MLTKTDLQSLRQCPRKLWLEHFKPGLVPRDEPSLHRRAADGAIVGDKAREALGDGALWLAGGADKTHAASAAVVALRARPDAAAVEVPFVREDLYARADALLPAFNGYVLQETKASTFPRKNDKVTPDKPEAHYLEDVAIQAWAMETSGLTMARAELNLLDSQWTYPGGNDYAGLFRQMDVTESVKLIAPSVPTWIDNAHAVLAGQMPPACTGRQCKEPYPCPFIFHCKALDPPGPEHPLTLLPDSAGKNLAKKLRIRGYESLLDVPPREMAGKQSALYLRIQAAHRSGAAILEPGADAFMAQLPYPRYYFDFEGIDLPVPKWPGVKPYEQIPFQWSCHIERSPGAFEHAAFLDLTGNDPSLDCILQMKRVIDVEDGGPIIVYYQTYEKGRLEGLAMRHADHAGALNRYIQRLVDLHPLVKDHFYDPRMMGSFSIKKVLPVIAPELKYTELEEVQEGTGAQVAYLYACFDEATSPERKAELRHRLLAYCEQDTWAMVEIGWFLEGRGRPSDRRPSIDLA